MRGGRFLAWTSILVPGAGPSAPVGLAEQRQARRCGLLEDFSRHLDAALMAVGQVNENESGLGARRRDSVRVIVKKRNTDGARRLPAQSDQKNGHNM